MRPSIPRAIVLALSLAAASSAAPARAEGPAAVALARELFVEASRLAEAGDWEGARRRYADSLELKRAAITLYSLGVAEHRTGHLVAATEHLRAFLASAPEAETDAYRGAAGRAIGEMAPSIARLRVVVVPAEAVPTVRVDGALLPAVALPYPWLVDPGLHTVRAEAAGFVPRAATVTTRPGESATVTLALDRPAGSRALPYALIGGGAGVLAAGAVVGLIGVGQASDAPTHDGDAATDARTTALVGDVLAGAGLVTGAVGVALWLLDDGPSEGARPVVSAGAAGLALRF